MPGNIPAFSIATNPIPKDGSDYDLIVVGGGVLGSAFAATFGKQGKRVLMLGKNKILSLFVFFARPYLSTEMLILFNLFPC